jgi:hypothetical protein
MRRAEFRIEDLPAIENLAYSRRTRRASLRARRALSPRPVSTDDLVCPPRASSGPSKGTSCARGHPRRGRRGGSARRGCARRPWPWTRPSRGRRGGHFEFRPRRAGLQEPRDAAPPAGGFWTDRLNALKRGNVPGEVAGGARVRASSSGRNPIVCSCSATSPHEALGPLSSDRTARVRPAMRVWLRGIRRSSGAMAAEGQPVRGFHARPSSELAGSERAGTEGRPTGLRTLSSCGGSSRATPRVACDGTRDRCLRKGIPERRQQGGPTWVLRLPPPTWSTRTLAGRIVGLGTGSPVANPSVVRPCATAVPQPTARVG